MNLSQNQRNHTPKHQKKRLSQDQVRLLEASFDASKKLEPDRKLHLARELGVPPRQIAIWYQNKRARWKSQSLEVDCGALQLRLDAALTEKRQLVEEAERLRGELKRARDMLLGYKWARVQAQAHEACVPPLSSFCDNGVGSWAVNHDVASRGAVLPFDEVYSCFMVGGDERDIYSKQ